MRSKPRQSRAAGQAAVQKARGKRCPEARLRGVWAILQAWAEDNALLIYPVFEILHTKSRACGQQSQRPSLHLSLMSVCDSQEQHC